MLEITGDHIAELNDEDLRSLVGLLCESELREHGLSPSAVTWGGNQNAPDGGIDVRVRTENGEPPGDYIPRNNTAFQVKKTDFTPSRITNEMRPKGQLRDSIRQLIREHGSYIIASSGSNTSDPAITDRLKAMRSAVADEPGHANLHLDFFDRNRLATWTRNHWGLVLWVRQKIGRAVPGWQPYSSWASSPDGLEDVYLLDDEARLHAGTTDEKGIDVSQGIARIRHILRQARGVVRLAGLSGVGKTRLVQALFDDRVGVNPLDPAKVIYTDMSDNPSPQPTSMISDLIALRVPAIVVIDNCAPDLHRRLTELCRGTENLVSTITVEYDVQDDEPEGTEAFRLEPSSDDLIGKLIARRYPSMTQLDVERIARFSGGNSRVALALANTVERGESVAGLTDEVLFKRLFHQRQAPDDSLLKASQACSLLYSFQGEALTGDDAELPKIAALVGLNAQQLYAKVAELRSRDVVQCRGVWRAILPHAIANRLAKMALCEIPLEVIEQQFNTDRLLRSFSRRLGYLHESGEARRIAQKWLGKDGILANIGTLTELGLAMFENIAPVSPELTLAAIERELSGTDASRIVENETRRNRIGLILQSIAYDALLFDRCVGALIPLALAEQSKIPSQTIRDVIKTLFQAFLSGTHATIEQRVGLAEGLLRSEQPGKRSLGLQVLEALLKAEHFTSSHSFEFGARVRDYGYELNTREEIANWFTRALQLARQFASKKGETVTTIRSMIAQAIQGVWFFGTAVQEQFEKFANEIDQNDYWQEGWIAVRWLLAHLEPEQEADTAALVRLRAFEQSLYPKNVEEQVRAIVLSQRWGPFDYADIEDEGREPAEPMPAHERADATAEELGRAVCADPAVFEALLPDLVSGNAGRLFPFGRGLAFAASDHRSVWEQLTAAVAVTPENKRNLGALGGFLDGLTEVDQALSESLLEEAVTHETLEAWFPRLQSCVRISAAGAERLIKAAALGVAKATAFQYLGWRSDINGCDLQTILLLLAKKEHGYRAAIDILAHRFHSDRNDKKEHAPELIDAGRNLLSCIDFEDRDSSYDYDLHHVANVCLQGSGGSAAAQSLCERIKQGLSDHSFRSYSYSQLLQSLFQLQPRNGLDAFFGNAPQTDASYRSVVNIDRASGRRGNALDGVPMEVMLQWCDERPDERYPSISRVVSYYITAKEGELEWSPLAIEMLNRAPDPLTVLKTFVNRFHPTIWSGSRASILESRLGLLDRLSELGNAFLEDYAEEMRARLVQEIAEERRREDESDSERDERFE